MLFLLLPLNKCRSNFERLNTLKLSDNASNDISIEIIPLKMGTDRILIKKKDENKYLKAIISDEKAEFESIPKECLMNQEHVKCLPFIFKIKKGNEKDYYQLINPKNVYLISIDNKMQLKFGSGQVKMIYKEENELGKRDINNNFDERNNNSDTDNTECEVSTTNKNSTVNDSNNLKESMEIGSIETEMEKLKKRVAELEEKQSKNDNINNNSGNNLDQQNNFSSKNGQSFNGTGSNPSNQSNQQSGVSYGFNPQSSGSYNSNNQPYNPSNQNAQQYNNTSYGSNPQSSGPYNLDNQPYNPSNQNTQQNNNLYGSNQPQNPQFMGNNNPLNPQTIFSGLKNNLIQSNYKNKYKRNKNTKNESDSSEDD
ncbi:hypothetical protein HERIO_2376 [Hepatospora eriocheir]|uniref:Uncharacterized protein n=1 Tax=Hepatospora eriocheir TaxID=1081669 RepID=A0A1X0Q771_9MICR|nr:hypothetical protein HERIO_2376 [Hepatospora eriocheir]